MAGQKKHKNTEQGTVNTDNTDITNEADETVEESMSEEYYLLDSQLDELNSALDFLEKRTDDITEKLKELLQSNIEIREELKNEKLQFNYKS